MYGEYLKRSLLRISRMLFVTILWLRGSSAVCSMKEDSRSRVAGLLNVSSFIR